MDRAAQPQGAALQIRVETRPSGTRLRFRNVAEKELVVDSNFTSSQLPELWSDLTEALGEFKDAVGGKVDVPVDRALKAARILNESGQYVLSLLFGAELGGVIDFCRENLALTPDPLVDLHVGMTEALPFEFLPLLDAADLPDDESAADPARIQAIYGRFLGLACVTRRVFAHKPQSQQNALTASPALPIRLYRHYGLDVSGNESGFFAENEADLRVMETWPGRTLPASPQAVAEFCTRLYDAASAHQVHHFSCHYETNDKRSSHSWLTLSDEGKKELQITIQKILQQFAAMEAHPEKRRRAGISMPMVFFNACGASQINPSSASTLPGALLNWKYRAFIGPATKVPDEPASMFARYFYNSLLAGRTVGQAVLDARRNLLYNHLSPIGLLYTLYGNPDLAIEKRLPQEQP
jgi:hypothetical protein